MQKYQSLYKLVEAFQHFFNKDNIVTTLVDLTTRGDFQDYLQVKLDTTEKFIYFTVLMYFKKNNMNLDNIENLLNNLYVYSRIENTGENAQESCEYCDNGNIDCENCGGTGFVSCDICNGTHKVDCLECDEGVDEEGEPCSECKGSGKITCDNCDRDGEVHCDECNHGSLECSECDGRGNVYTDEYIYEIITLVSWDLEMKQKLLESLNNKEGISVWNSNEDSSIQLGFRKFEDRTYVDEGEYYCCKLKDDLSDIHLDVHDLQITSELYAKKFINSIEI